MSSCKKGGGSVQQPLSFLDPTQAVPNAHTPNLLQQDGLLLRPRIGGGAQPLSYVDPTYLPPSSSAGTDLLKQDGLLLRPRIGGFFPSVMKGVVNSGAIIAPLALVTAKKMWNTRKGGGKKEDWARNREAAREELGKYGKPSALNINKYAALLRKNESGAEDFLVEYILRKRKSGKKTKKNTVVKNKTVKNKPIKTEVLWKNLVERAKKDLEKYGKPSGANLSTFASLQRKGLNTKEFVKSYKTRKQYKSPEKTARNKYQNNLQQGRQFLSQFGKPTVANVSKFVSLKRKGLNTGAVENAVKSRAKPVTVKFAIKPTQYSPPPL